MNVLSDLTHVMGPVFAAMGIAGAVAGGLNEEFWPAPPQAGQGPVAGVAAGVPVLAGNLGWLNIADAAVGEAAPATAETAAGGAAAAKQAGRGRQQENAVIDLTWSDDAELPAQLSQQELEAERRRLEQRRRALDRREQALQQRERAAERAARRKGMDAMNGR